MRAARVPAGPILRPVDLLTEPQFLARGMFHSAAPPPPLAREGKLGAGSGGESGSSESSGGSGGLRNGCNPAVTMPAITPVLSGTPGSTRWAGAALGRHTDEVLAEAGVGADEAARLRDLGVIA